jgi:hypothetical protein
VAGCIESLGKKADYVRAVQENSVIDVRTVEIDYKTPELLTEDGVAKVYASDRNLTTLYNAARRKLDGDVAKRVVELIDPQATDPRTARLRIFTYTDRTGELEALDSFAETKIESMLDDIDVLALSDADRQRLNLLRGGARDQSVVPMTVPDFITPPKSKAASAPDHLYVGDEDLDSLNAWEAAVLAEERTRKGFVGWLRNIDRQEWALGIIHDQPGGGVLYPDLLVFRKVSRKIVVDILDPHGPNIEDAAGKARALARYAGRPHSLVIGHIEIIQLHKGVPMRLDVMDPKVRQMVEGVRDRATLDNVFATNGKQR